MSDGESDSIPIEESNEKMYVPEFIPRQVPEPYVPPPKQAYEGYGGGSDEEDYEAAHPARGGRESSRRVRQLTRVALDAGLDYGEASAELLQAAVLVLDHRQQRAHAVAAAALAASRGRSGCARVEAANGITEIGG